MEQNDVRIKDSVAAKRAGVTPRTIDRWSKDPKVNYPAADITKGRKYRWLSQIEAWEQKNPNFGPERMTRKEPSKQVSSMPVRVPEFNDDLPWPDEEDEKVI